MDLGLKGKVAALGGATSGIGFACAEALLSEGAHVSVCGRNSAKLNNALEELKTKGTATGVSADLSTEEGVDTFLQHTREKLGPIDILLVNTGGPPPGTLQNLDDKHWREATDLLLMSAVRLVRQVSPQMAQNGGGRILFITSISVRQPLDNLILSNSLRCGVTGFAKTCSRLLAPKGITVNCVCPGYTKTQRLDTLAADQAQKQAGVKKEIFKNWCENIPAGRLGLPEEVGAAVVFLASNKASYITGTSLCVDGGWTHALY